uniref:Uncharacterized protein n=1 Tax=Desertifilum tharense IPPAS B-1220 TaxID=1781255 RepID=A0ACD5H2X6_9CYAN
MVVATRLKTNLATWHIKKIPHLQPILSPTQKPGFFPQSRWEAKMFAETRFLTPRQRAIALTSPKRDRPRD